MLINQLVVDNEKYQIINHSILINLVQNSESWKSKSAGCTAMDIQFKLNSLL